MDSALSDKVVFITGASGGIGRALAEIFAGEGARVALQGFSKSAELDRWVADRPWHDRALTVKADVRSPEDMDAAIDEAQSLWGRVDVCVANAGSWPPADHPLHEMPLERLRDTIETNLLGAAWTARSFLRGLAEKGPRKDGHGAALVFIGSTAGRFGERDHCDYAMSKAGMYGLVRSLKNEIVRIDPYGRVNMVEPGWTVTAMARPAIENPELVRGVVRTMAMRQLARAKDIAHTVAYLSSPTLARHVSGEVITVAGGMEGRSLWREDQVDYDEIRARLERE